ncbi:methyltransferase [Tenacibaculum xiamenense]|uniref:methyltransferase n=1 Tax=Tenacibaculum xiamenense TaxID=1261553 RepID=UPI0038945E8C
MRSVIKYILDPVIKKAFLWYHSKPRKYSYHGITVTVLPEVFPPHFTLSTKILLNFINKLDLIGKTVLELGCGSGIISMFSASKNAHVTASDINKIALRNLKLESKKNNLPIQVIYSDLFDNINQSFFDYIIINPPYYPRSPKNTQEKAWFCGKDFEYFEKLFSQLVSRADHKNAYLILSEDCDFKAINEIAEKNNLQLKCVLEKKVFFEKNYIYSIL